jgi:hypothetical protein
MHIKMHDKCRFVKRTAATVQITPAFSGAPRGASVATFSKRRDARVRPLQRDVMLPFLIAPAHLNAS